MLSGFSSGKIFLISFHRSSGIRIIVVIYFFIIKHLTDMIRNKGAIILSIFGIGSKNAACSCADPKGTKPETDRYFEKIYKVKFQLSYQPQL